MNKILVWFFLATTIAIGIWFGIYHFSKQKEISNLKKINVLLIQKETKRIKDSVTFVVDRLMLINKKTTDSLRVEEQNIKLVPYEKLIYADRDVDSALDTISKYKYDTRTKAKGG